MVMRIVAIIGQIGENERVTMTGGVTKNKGVTGELEK